jgi:predicted CopG family antitoxin
MDAYEALTRHKKPGQSFSQVIKEHFGTLRTGRDLRTAIKRIELSDGLLDAIDRVVASREDHPARTVNLS